MNNLLYFIFIVIGCFAIVVMAILLGEPEDEIFKDDINENNVITPQHTCVVCHQKYWSWQMMNATTCIDCYRKKVRK